jgi:hypothetical protein
MPNGSGRVAGGGERETRSIRLTVTANEVDFLVARGYPLDRTDNRSIAEAVSACLADSVMEGA